jgi:cytoskeletal protein CcmA (bactofilin family)
VLVSDAAKDAAVIDEGATFAGSFKGHDLLVLGRFEGEIELDGRLRVGPSGKARAEIRATTVEIAGEVDGQVRAESLSLLPTARVRGTFLAKRLSVAEGAVVEGSINPTPPTRPDSGFTPTSISPISASYFAPTHPETNPEDDGSP